MRIVALLLLNFVPSVAVPAAHAQEARPGLKRELLLAAPSAHDRSFERQIAILNSNKQALRERDIEVVLVFDRASERERAPFAMDELFILLNSRDEAEQRRDLHISRNRFTVILIGKDGGEKLRQHTPISIDKLNATIDAMPMRQDEMREQKR